MIQMTPTVENAEMIAFVTIVDAGSFTRAADELRVPRATLGRRLSRLEDRLGARLLRRTTRSLVLTEAGETFYRHARLALEATTRAEQSVRRGSGKIAGSLRVSVPPLTLPPFLAFLVDFAERYPDVRVSTHFGTRHVDLLRDGYDVALRAGTVVEPGLVVRALVSSDLVAVAAPSYLAGAGVPTSADDLPQHRCLVAFDRAELPRRAWTTTQGEIAIEGSFFTNEMQLLVAAARRALGIAMVPMRLVAQDLAEGSLVWVLPDLLYARGAVSVVYPEREHLPVQVRAFVDALVEWAPNLDATPPFGAGAGER